MVNMIVRKEDGKLCGHNTDSDGALINIVVGLSDSCVTKLNTNTPPKHIRSLCILY